jgi:hypothetical protein
VPVAFGGGRELDRLDGLLVGHELHEAAQAKPESSPAETVAVEPLARRPATCGNRASSSRKAPAPVRRAWSSASFDRPSMPELSKIGPRSRST